MKLANNMTKMTDSVMFKEGKNIASESRKNIFRGKVTPGLAPATIERRAEGTSDYEADGHRPFSTRNANPLYYTGELHDSIRATKTGVEMNAYGEEHHRGWGEVKREFIEMPGSDNMKKHEEKLGVDLVKDMIKEMMF
tara:strand:- start:238 stop:651 length:414 start_codon:yes stop_codon:yes gene_type:complete